MNTNKAHCPIGMFDSGIGGLTVMQQVIDKMPYEDIIYFGDTARLPYGEKSPETIVKYSIENAIFLIEKNVKLIVIPCNTATSVAIDTLRQIFNIPVIGVIEPGAERALQVTQNHRIAVLGTRGTINSGAYQKAILKLSSKTKVFPVICPLFVPLVEEHFIDHAATKMIVSEYLQPLLKENVDTILLGCTHYPLLKPLIQEVVGESVCLVDSATTCAQKILEALKFHEIETPSKSAPSYQYFVSDAPERFKSVGQSFLGSLIQDVFLTRL